VEFLRELYRIFYIDDRLALRITIPIDYDSKGTYRIPTVSSTDQYDALTPSRP